MQESEADGRARVRERRHAQTEPEVLKRVVGSRRRHPRRRRENEMRLEQRTCTTRTRAGRGGRRLEVKDAATSAAGDGAELHAGGARVQKMNKGSRWRVELRRPWASWRSRSWRGRTRGEQPEVSRGRAATESTKWSVRCRGQARARATSVGVRSSSHKMILRHRVIRRGGSTATCQREQVIAWTSETGRGVAAERWE
jgi:hypothetical protein